MKNKKKTYALVAILLAIAALGIGYAVISSVLQINGDAHILQSDGATVNFKTGTASASGGQTGTTASITDGTTAVCTVYLKTLNETASCEYTIKNVSTNTALTATGLTATVYESNGTTAWSSTSDGYEYITITPALGTTTLANAAETTVTVTVQLIKENTTGADLVKSFVVKVDGNTTQ